MIGLSEITALVQSAALPEERALLAQALAEAARASKDAAVQAAARSAAGAGDASAALFRLRETDGAEAADGLIRSAVASLQGHACHSAVCMAAHLPFLMAWEVQCNRMATLGAVADVFRRRRAELTTGLHLLALADTIENCNEQIYEHWRALVDIYRECVRNFLREGCDEAAERAFASAAIIKGVRLGWLDPERYGSAALAMARQACDAGKITNAVSAAAWLRADAEIRCEGGWL